MAQSFKGEMFDKFPVDGVKHNTFTLDKQVLFTTEWGRLTPILCIPNNPKETFKIGISSFVRMMPMATPIMHQVECFCYAFWVRNPILWDNWRDFIRGGKDGKGLKKGTVNVAPPNIFSSTKNPRNYGLLSDLITDKEPGDLIAPKSLWDYLGYATPLQKSLLNYRDNVSSDGEISEYFKSFEPVDILPFKGYQAIYNEYFRDEYIDDEIELFTDVDGDHLAPIISGANESQKGFIDFLGLQELFKIRYRRWEKDPFTSSLQEPIAVPDVKIPFNADINIVGKNDFVTASLFASPTPGFIANGVLGTEGQNIEGTVANPNLVKLGQVKTSLSSEVGGINTAISKFEPYTNPGLSLQFDRIVNNLDAGIANITATIAELRNAVAMQEFYELSARAGNRYKEMLIAHFNSIVPDYTLDRPQYLGGTRFTLGISQVLQTSASEGEGASAQPLGQMAGQGMAGSGDFLFKETFLEHGWIYLIFSIRPRSMYTQIMPRYFQRLDRMDYYWPKLAHVGDQAVLGREVFCDPLHSSLDSSYKPNEEFGYQSRNWEYKYLPNTVHGDFKTTLKDWHLARMFETSPRLNSDFLEVKGENLNRVFAYMNDDYDHFLVQSNIDITASRPIPIFSVPKFS